MLDRLTRYKRLEQYPDDMELLDDVIVEIRQAIEMTGIYRDDIKGTRELFSAVLDNRLNNTMKMADFGHADHGGADRDLGAIRHERQPGQHAVCGQFVRVRHRVRG